jgi:hypothetical protein
MKSAALYSVFYLSRKACWAVGVSSKQEFTGPNASLAEHWNGTRWTIVATP